jgi:Domain of unknown function (DUF4372)
MNVGQTLFAQVMDDVPWKTVGRIIQRHGGDAVVRTLSCADLFRVGLKRASPFDLVRCVELARLAHQLSIFLLLLNTAAIRFLAVSITSSIKRENVMACPV